MRPLYISPAEALAIFLNFIGMNEPIAVQCHLFGLSNTVVQKAKYSATEAIRKALCHYFLITSVFWRKAKNFVPAHEEFNGVLGAIDGTHIPIRIAAPLTETFRNRKGFVTTNVLICCNFNMKLLYVRTGLPGSSHDSPVYTSSELATMLNLLSDEYFILADAGYALSNRLLTPFRSTRYHLKEFGSGTSRPSTPMELLNLRHSKMRNILERVIGVLKRRWRLLRHGNESLDFEFMSLCI